MANISYVYLINPTFQFMNVSGKPLVDGYVNVYISGTRSKYYAFSDFDGTVHPFNIPLNSLGSAVILVSPAHSYDIYVYNSVGTLQMSRFNITPATGEGTDVTTITSKDGTVDITANSSKNYDLSIATKIAELKEYTDQAKNDAIELANTNAEQISLIKQSLNADKWVSLNCVPYNSNIELTIMNAGYRNGFLNFNGSVQTKNGTTFVTNAVNYIFSVEGVTLLLDFRNYYGTCAYNSSNNLYPCAMAALKNTNTFYIYPTQTCNIFYFNGTVPVELVS